MGSLSESMMGVEFVSSELMGWAGGINWKDWKFDCYTLFNTARRLLVISSESPNDAKGGNVQTTRKG